MSFHSAHQKWQPINIEHAAPAQIQSRAPISSQPTPARHTINLCQFTVRVNHIVFPKAIARKLSSSQFYVLLSRGDKSSQTAIGNITKDGRIEYNEAVSIEATLLKVTFPGTACRRSQQCHIKRTEPLHRYFRVQALPSRAAPTQTFQLQRSECKQARIIRRLLQV